MNGKGDDEKVSATTGDRKFLATMRLGQKVR
jgi:hypothetical protein